MPHIYGGAAFMQGPIHVYPVSWSLVIHILFEIEGNTYTVIIGIEVDLVLF